MIIFEVLQAILTVVASLIQSIYKLVCELLSSTLGGIVGAVAFHYWGMGSEVFASVLGALFAGMTYLLIARRMERALSNGVTLRVIHSLTPSLGTLLGCRLSISLGSIWLAPLFSLLCTDLAAICTYKLRAWIRE